MLFPLSGLHQLKLKCHFFEDLTCKRGSVGQSEGFFLPFSSFRFQLKPENSSPHGFDLHRPSIKGTILLLKVTKAIIIFIRLNVFMH